MQDLYQKRGVSSGKEEVHAAIAGLSKGLYPSAFCKILPDIAGGDEAWCNLMHADTAGTKSSLAYLYWKETGNLDVWKGIAQDALVMNLDDMACVGVTDQFIISSTIGRNKHLIPGEVLKAIIDGTYEFIDQMAAMGIRIHHSGGETADVGDIVRTIDVGITAFARWPKKNLLINQIQEGDVIVSLASYGQSTYEKVYNSGIGSNGLTGARHDLLHKSYSEKYPETFSPETDPEVTYAGSKKLTDPSPIEGFQIGDLLLSPTRTYLPVLKDILKDQSLPINGIIHCTGGAMTKVLHFADGVHIVKNNLLPIPPLFKLIQEENRVSWKEMYKVFNMGQRLEFYTDQKSAETILSIASAYQIEARVSGYVEADKETKVTVESSYGKFEYVK